MDSEPQPIAPVHLPQTLRDQMRQHAQATYPEECCGLLLGRDRSILHALPANNTADPAHRRTTYAIDPRDILRADHDARAKNLDILGYYHSHPDHRAVPSAADRAPAWEGVLYIIVPVTATEAGQPRAWQLNPTEGFSEVPLAP